MKIGVVDYDAGNLTSVRTALEKIGAEYYVFRHGDQIKDADKVIFPGVGEARSSMDVLQKRGLDTALRDWFKSGKPMLGICVGCQLTLSFSEERDTECLDLIKGKVRLFPEKEGFKVPQMGWNSVKYLQPHYIFKDIPEHSSFYFVHSYYPEPEAADTFIGETEYSLNFISAFAKDNLIATQFHPEKSGPAGLKMLDNFINQG